MFLNSEYSELLHFQVLLDTSNDVICSSYPSFLPISAVLLLNNPGEWKRKKKKKKKMHVDDFIRRQFNQEIITGLSLVAGRADIFASSWNATMSRKEWFENRSKWRYKNTNVQFEKKKKKKKRKKRKVFKEMSLSKMLHLIRNKGVVWKALIRNASLKEVTEECLILMAVIHAHMPFIVFLPTVRVCR